jgi:putative nucleotidyltransferase with HDIG domain
MSQNKFRTLSLGTRVYVLTVATAGAITVLQSFYALAVRPMGWNWAILAILTLVSGSATVRLPSLPATISVSETFVFTSVLLFGSAAGTLTVALDALVISCWSYRKGQPLYKIIFNVCALPLTIWIAAHLFFLFPSIEPLSTSLPKDPIRLSVLVGPLLLFTIVYFALNSWIITLAISLERRLPAFAIWRDNFLWLSLNYFGGASVAALLVSYTRELDFTYLAVIIPLLIVLYLTFSMSMGRVADANRHLTELNALYMSTIETLAMAIDAKDQITHGHIRRVQSYAVALAKEVGVADAALIKAVEAAALLHDMGKLAVPEYILNKPGALTPAEFEKMKLHASVGADILSSIDFPYPVVPIVRHHHENWDGTGYPDRLHGTDIPIGARILSVVDCFDALTSDRPYRPRLSDKDALNILIERRGTMYDPLVVDTFLRVYDRIIPPVADPSETWPLLAIAEASSTVARTPPQTQGLEDIASSTDETLTLFDLARGLSSPKSLTEVGETIFKHLRRLIPYSTGVVFVYDVDRDDLHAAHAFGENSSLVAGLRIGIGQRLSGWVAANRRSIRNSDPILDFGEAARGITPRPRSCLSTPLLVDQRMIGVISLYSTGQNAFTEEHQRVLEAVSKQVGSIVHQALDRSKGQEGLFHDPLSALPHFEEIAASSGSLLNSPVTEPTSILFIALNNSRDVVRTSGKVEADQALSRLLNIVRRNLRAGDLVYRHDEMDFIVLLVGADNAIAETVGTRIRKSASADHTITPKGLSVVTVAASTLDAARGTIGDQIGKLVLGPRLNGRAQAPPSDSVH